MIKRARPKGSRHHHKSLNHQKGLATRWRPSELLGLRPPFGRPTELNYMEYIVIYQSEFTLV